MSPSLSTSIAYLQVKRFVVQQPKCSSPYSMRGGVFERQSYLYREQGTHLKEAESNLYKVNLIDSHKNHAREKICLPAMVVRVRTTKQLGWK